MAAFPDTTTMPEITRRRMLTGAAAALATSAAGILAMGVGASARSIPGAMISLKAEPFDAAAHVDDVIAVGLDCVSIYREEKCIMFCYWEPQSVGGDPDDKKCQAFLAELKRRGLAYQMLPGETLYDAQRRIRPGKFRAWPFAA